MDKIVTIPYWESDPGKKDVLKRCLTSFEGNSVLVLAGKQETLPTAWNMCLDMGFGVGADFVILSNDDVELTRGNLSDLCVKERVVSPLVNNEVYKVFHAHIFSIPKEVYEKVGKFDESFKVYWADTDYALRLVRHNVPVEINEDVNVRHPEPARTLKHTAKQVEQEDKNTFKEKHGELWFDPVKGIKL